MSKNLRKMVTFGLVLAMGILPMSAHSNIAYAQEKIETLVMAKQDEIDSFDNLAGMTLDLSDKNIVPDDSGKVEIEGLQIINDKIYMGISPKAENQRNRAFIYYIDNGLIHE